MTPNEDTISGDITCIVSAPDVPTNRAVIFSSGTSLQDIISAMSDAVHIDTSNMLLTVYDIDADCHVLLERAAQLCSSSVAKLAWVAIHPKIFAEPKPESVTQGAPTAFLGFGMPKSAVRVASDSQSVVHNIGVGQFSLQKPPLPFEHAKTAQVCTCKPVYL